MVKLNLDVSRNRTFRFENAKNQEEFFKRIAKSLYYGESSCSDCFSIPLTELAVELFSKSNRNVILEELGMAEAAEISRNTCATPYSLVLATLYLERMKDANPEYIRKVAPSELFLISLMVASKFLHDEGEEESVLNSEWAASVGMSTQEINSAEVLFLQSLDWNIFFDDSAFWHRLREIELQLANYQGSRRGWYTYTELASIFPTIHTAVLLKHLSVVYSLFVMSYVAGVLSFITSITLVNEISQRLHQSPLDASLNPNVSLYVRPSEDYARTSENYTRPSEGVELDEIVREDMTTLPVTSLPPPPNDVAMKGYARTHLSFDCRGFPREFCDSVVNTTFVIRNDSAIDADSGKGAGNATSLIQLAVGMDRRVAFLQTNFF